MATREERARTKRRPIRLLMTNPSFALVVVLFSLAGIALAELLLANNVNIGDARLWAWITSMILVSLALIMLGWCINGRWYGLLIDARNKASLARLQLVLWTAVLIPAIAAAGLTNWVTSGSDALKITIPDTVLAVLGISLGVAAGTPLIMSAKQSVSSQAGANGNPSTQTTPAAPSRSDPAVKALADSGVTGADRNGAVLVKDSPDSAQLLDLFRGDDVSNGAYLDVSKVQMFYITAILVFIYALMLGSSLSASTRAFDKLPDFNAGMLTLLAISHGGYLTYKAVPHPGAT